MLKSYKYRLYPTAVQCEALAQHFGACRLVWNLALSAKQQAWESNRVYVSRYDLQEQLIDLKLANEWLYNINSQSLQGVLLNLEKAYKQFFENGGFPKFKNKSGRQSFQCPQRCKLFDGLLSIPNIGKVAIELSRSFIGKMKTVTISKTPTGKYFASILVDTAQDRLLPNPINIDSIIGVDLGIKSFVVSSDGKIYPENRRFKTSLGRLKCLQQRASRKKKGSNNRKKANKRVAILHEKIANQRTDYIHKVTTGLIRDNQASTIVIEDLNVHGMRQNRRLAQAISDVGFGEFRRQIEYKCDWYGKNLIIIDRFEPTSKTCSACGEVNQNLTLSDREWTCICGVTHNRDLNAAINIKNAGFKKYSGEGISGEPVELSAIAEIKRQESFHIMKPITNLEGGLS